MVYSSGVSFLLKSSSEIIFKTSNTCGKYQWIEKNNKIKLPSVNKLCLNNMYFFSNNIFKFHNNQASLSHNQMKMDEGYEKFF